MAVNSRQKGKRGESSVQSLLSESTGLSFECTPGSGSGVIKGDLYVPKAKNRFCIEIKNYAESHFNDKIFTNKSNNFNIWWNKLQIQAKQCGQEPLLIFKYNRSKLFVTTNQKPVNTDKFVDISWLKCYTLLLEDWLKAERIEWLR